MGGSKMTPKNRILEGKNWTLGGDGGSKIVKNRRTSFMDDPFYSKSFKGSPESSKAKKVIEPFNYSITYFQLVYTLKSKL